MMGFAQDSAGVGSRNPPAAALEIRNLSISYRGPGGTCLCVDGVDLDLSAGEIVGLAGEISAGKSTLALRHPCRLLRPPAVITSGNVIYRGRRAPAASRSTSSPQTPRPAARLCAGARSQSCFRAR